jgi:hypothetical protein
LPHIGGSTEESITMARAFMAEKLIHHIKTNFLSRP